MSGSRRRCVTFRNTEQVNENADAARRFEPLKQG